MPTVQVLLMAISWRRQSSCAAIAAYATPMEAQAAADKAKRGPVSLSCAATRGKVDLWEARRS